MPQTISKQYDRYSVDFKRLAVALTLHPDILSMEVAEQLGIHPVMLYRWRMEMRKGDLPNKEKVEDIVTETNLIKANRKIKKLEQQLEETTRERDFLKKARRFFQDQK